ncbi:MAG: hypothetical protein LBC60_01290 [Spirochaetaceae bacterium]|nr:hypothetical protein [Spirochaetaceae bacterium]
MKKNFMSPRFIVMELLAVLMLCGFIGCATTAPPAGPVGFPLIDIVDAEVEIADESRFAKNEDEWVRNENTKIIGGSLGSQIVPKDITITLIETSIQIPIKNGEDITDWFLNIPKGLKATAYALDPEAKYAADKGAVRIIATIEGVPEQTINQPIQIRVPWEKTNRSWDFHIPANNDRRFEVYGVDMAAVIVGGAVNRDIDPKTFRIKFGGTKLTESIAQDTDISSWFTNIPQGLKAVISENAVPVSEGQQTLTVTISGVPTVQVNEKILVRIPADITTANIVLEIPPSDKALYDIGSFSSIPVQDIELRTGSNWKGVQQGWGLTGPEVFKSKDFTAIGIIQLQSQSVYKIGEDGEYHWTGNYITYGDLMAEAKKLDAHAIIDVVIDYNDQVNETTEKRHVEAGHTPTILESIKLKKGLIIEEVDPNGGTIYVEKIEVVNRIWTGTALAIQYAPAYAPNIGEGGSMGYVPSVPAIPLVPTGQRN